VSICMKYCAANNSFIGQVNNLLCQFDKLDSFMRNGLFKVHCSILYGCEIWDLHNRSLSDLCVALRKGSMEVIYLFYLITQEICNKTGINVNEVRDAHSMVVTGYKTANVTPELN